MTRSGLADRTAASAPGPSDAVSTAMPALLEVVAHQPGDFEFVVYDQDGGHVVILPMSERKGAAGDDPAAPCRHSWSLV